MSYLYFIGIDIAKDSFDWACHDTPNRAGHLSNSVHGFNALYNAFRDKSEQVFIVLEATGGYENALVDFLLAHNIAVHRVQPLKSAHYIRSLRVHGKTDALDAVALARYGAERHANLAVLQPIDNTLRTLQALQARRKDLLTMRTAETQRLKHPGYCLTRQSVQTVRDVLNGEIASVEKQMVEMIECNEVLKAKFAVLKAFKGVGTITALCILADMPELGTLTRKQAASLAGVAPHPKQSGKMQGYRSTRGGRQSVRNTLFMAALSAKNYNVQLKPFFERLVKNGKKPIVALTAVMRKMIVILNAKLRDSASPQFIF